LCYYVTKVVLLDLPRNESPKMSWIQRIQAPNLPNPYDKFKLVSNNTKGFDLFFNFLSSLSCKGFLFFLSARILENIGDWNCYFAKYYVQNWIEKINNDELQLIFS
jgi:hypothetical protein